MGEGSANITAHQAASANYLAATDVSKSVTVTHNPSTGIQKPFEINPLTVTKNAVISNVDGVMQVYTFNGVLLNNKNVIKSETIKLNSGAYIIRVATTEGISVQKIIL